MSQLQMNQTVTMTEIADAAGVSKPTASVWRNRYRDTFPHPLPESSPNRPLFALTDIEQWYRKQFPDRKPLGLAKRSISKIHTAMMSILRGALDTSEAAAAIVGLLTWHTLAHDAELHGVVTWNGDKIAAHEVPGFPRLGVTSAVPGNSLETLRRATDQLRTAGLNSIALLVDPLWRESQDHRWATERTISLFETVAHLNYGDTAEVADALLTDPQAGYYPSSPVLAELLARLVHSDHTTIWDPAAGVGNLLASAHQSVPTSHLAGTDISQVAAALCTARAYLHNWPATMSVGDAFLEPSRQYDAIIIDPPLGTRLDAWATEALSRQLDFPAIPSSRSEIGWVCLAAARLTPDMGAAAVVTAGGTTFAKGAVAGARRALVTNGYVEAIIRLPRKATTASPDSRTHRPRTDFRYDTSVDLYIWVIKPRDSFDSIVFIDGEQLLGDTEEKTISNILAAIENGEKPAGATTVSILDVLKRQDVPLHPGAWLPQDKTTTTDYLTTLRTAAALLRTTIDELDLPLPDLTLADSEPALQPLTDVAEVIRSRPIPKEGIHSQPGKGLVPIVKPTPTGLATTGYVTGDDTARSYLRSGDVLVHPGVKGPSAAVWRSDEKSVPHPLTTVVRADPTRVDAEYLSFCMLGPDVAATRTGTTIPRLNLQHALIPNLPITRQRAIAEALAQGQALIGQAQILQTAATEWRDSAASLASLGNLQIDQKARQ